RDALGSVAGVELLVVWARFGRGSSGGSPG
ncbi:MAG: hypothetical protein QOF58_3234, partial [Pseudonocardiales bacterium]|nr:hypothetical protein [Pseudonocardiales bacterium]